jgi:DNA invertase Pin-like site-specific DNA recombinase
MESSKSNLPVAILVRVSTAKQDTERQISELREVARRKNFAVVEVCEETVLGRPDVSRRVGLKRAEELAVSGKVRKVLVHEISRLARKNSIIHNFVETLEECGASLYWNAEGIDTMLDNGKRNQAASIMLALLAEMARSEADTLRDRIKSGLTEARRRGKKLGRPTGSTLPVAAFLKKHRDLVRLLRAGQSIRNTAKITSKGISTVQRVKRLLAANRHAVAR